MSFRPLEAIEFSNRLKAYKERLQICAETTFKLLLRRDFVKKFAKFIFWERNLLHDLKMYQQKFTRRESALELRNAQTSLRERALTFEESLIPILDIISGVANAGFDMLHVIKCILECVKEHLFSLIYAQRLDRLEAIMRDAQDIPNFELYHNSEEGVQENLFLSDGPSAVYDFVTSHGQLTTFPFVYDGFEKGDLVLLNSLITDVQTAKGMHCRLLNSSAFLEKYDTLVSYKDSLGNATTCLLSDEIPRSIPGTLLYKHSGSETGRVRYQKVREEVLNVKSQLTHWRNVQSFIQSVPYDNLLEIGCSDKPVTGALRRTLAAKLQLAKKWNGCLQTRDLFALAQNSPEDVRSVFKDHWPPAAVDTLLQDMHRIKYLKQELFQAAINGIYSQLDVNYRLKNSMSSREKRSLWQQALGYRLMMMNRTPTKSTMLHSKQQLNEQ